MTISAPQDGKTPRSPGETAISDETMEGVPARARGSVSYEGPRHDPSDTRGLDAVRAPLPAPHGWVALGLLLLAYAATIGALA
jgi:hypothetical protein